MDGGNALEKGEEGNEELQAGTETPPQLPAQALPAWRAWVQMQRSKRNHFAFMRDLEDKYPPKSGQKPALAEGLHLQALLDIHDEKVKAFSAAMQEINDPETRMALIKAMQ